MTWMMDALRSLLTTNSHNGTLLPQPASSLSSPTRIVRRDLLREYPNYRALRRAEGAVMQSLCNVLPEAAFDATASRLGFTGQRPQRMHLCETSMVCEQTLFHYRPDGRNVIENVAEESPPPEGSLEFLWLRALLDSYYTVLLIRESIPGFGLRGTDFFSGEERIIGDLAMSRTAKPGSAVLARLIPISTFWGISASSFAPFEDEDGLNRIRSYWETTFPGVSDVRQLNRHQSREFDRYLIRTVATLDSVFFAFSAGDFGNRFPQMYEPDPSSVAVVSVTSNTRRPRIGRNDICPCGSGKKYKRCCGHGVR